MLEVLIFLEYYLPGYTSGGPIRTISNLVDQLGNDFRFKIITSHLDPRDPEPYRDVQVDVFQKVGKAEVFYASPASLSIRGMRQLVSDTSHHVLYLNSFFSPRFSIQPVLLRKLGLIPPKPLIVAPRGEFSPGALAIKAEKKKAFLYSAKALKLHKGVLWAATSPYEETDIRHWFGEQSRVAIAPNLAQAVPDVSTRPGLRRKESGRLKLLFLSRIARKKNLDAALRILEGIEEAVEFDIYGTQEDETYWAECRRLIDKLPANIAVQYKGAVPHEEVRGVMSKYDVFFFPTHGENYGHAIVEALSVGCPVLISDQTPWRNLEGKKVGWDVSLSDVDRFRSILRRCSRMKEDEFQEWKRAAQAYAHKVIRDSTLLEQNRHLFEAAARIS